MEGGASPLIDGRQADALRKRARRSFFPQLVEKKRMRTYYG